MRELLIADDGDGTLAQHIPLDERIRYIRIPAEYRTLGAKRNFANTQTQGDLIVHWDDDDWMSPNRISMQVDALTASGADVCGARDLLYYALYEGQAWYYRFPQPSRVWVAGNTLMYRRDVWNTHPFPDQHVGEDNAFLAQFAPHQIHALTDSSFIIGLIHSQNTAPKRLNPPTWERRSFDEVTRLIGADRDFYIQLRHGKPRTIGPAQSTSDLTLCAHFDVYTGYGSMAEYLALAIARLEVKLHIQPVSLHPEALSQEFLKLVERSVPSPHHPVLYFLPVRHELDWFARTRDLFINTMWESDRLPPGWADRLNRARAVIAPTRFVANTMRASGVRVPVEVVSEGIDPSVYHWIERPERPGIVTLIMSPIADRKNTMIGIEAWKAAFADDPDARLIIKTSYGYHNYTPDDPRISYTDRFEATRGLPHWYQQADVLLALGNEGFGLPMVEGMATGLPVIVLNSEGQADVCEDAPDYVLPVRPSTFIPYNNSVFGVCGIRGIPAVSDVAEKLRWVAEHRSEAREMGRQASMWAQEHRSIWSKGAGVIDVIEHHLHEPRLLRRQRSMWIPSWGTECGVAEYTAHLTRALYGVHITKTAPEVSQTRLLHIQYAGKLFQDSTLTQTVQKMHAAAIPVIITEHEVTHQAQAWERDASILVAHTPAAVAQLRTRWPHKQIEHIPQGCPTWFPPRKNTRGKVIGVFGFLERHKGFWKLLQVLRALPGTELVMYSHARSPEQEYEWENAAHGLPVRRVSDFLPANQISRHLAAEADILVYWYDEVHFIASSAAVRIGLASGVPVLTSATSWFSDLTEVTYQPHDLIQGVQRLLDETELRNQLTESAREYCNTHSWEHMAARHIALWQAVESHA